MFGETVAYLASRLSLKKCATGVKLWGIAWPCLRNKLLSLSSLSLFQVFQFLEVFQLVKLKHNILKWKVNSKLLTLHVIWLNNGFTYNNVVILAISQNKHIRQQNCLVRLFTSSFIFLGGSYKRIAFLKNYPKDDPIQFPKNPPSFLILKPFPLVHCLVLMTVVSYFNCELVWLS